jgi:hypothetical protein
VAARVDGCLQLYGLVSAGGFASLFLHFKKGGRRCSHSNPRHHEHAACLRSRRCSVPYVLCVTCGGGSFAGQQLAYHSMTSGGSAWA